MNFPLIYSRTSKGNIIYEKFNYPLRKGKLNKTTVTITRLLLEDKIQYSQAKGTITKVTEPSKLFAVQTPQIFSSLA